MKFSEVKSKAISCLLEGAYDHEARDDIDVKNLFACGEVSAEYVVELIKKTRGNECTSSPHHQDATTEVYVVKTTKDGKAWYVKFYFLEPDVVFISVHE